MKTPKEIFDSKYEIYRNMNGKPSIPLEARPLIFAVAELYHSQFKLFAVTDEEIKQSFCNQLEEILRGVKLKYFCTDEDDALPLIDHLCQTGSKDISSGMEEIENIVEQVYFEFNIDALKSQLKPDEKEEKKWNPVCFYVMNRNDQLDIEQLSVGFKDYDKAVKFQNDTFCKEKYPYSFIMCSIK